MSGYRIALRPDGGDTPHVLDDVVVNNVSMFRAEALSDKAWWLRCHLDGTGTADDYIEFHVAIKDRRLVFTVTEYPTGNVNYEPPDGAS